MEEKKVIRQTIRNRRNSLSEETCDCLSGIIEKRLISQDWFLEAQSILLYAAFQKEVRTDQIARKAWELGKQVYCPRVEGEQMEFYLIKSFDDLSSENSGYGIPEPSGNGKRFLKGEPQESVLVIMPGVAFDRQCNRIGYGGGFYDRYFADWKEKRSIALAYDIQIIEKVPADVYDVRPERIVTESAIYEG